MKFYFAWVSYPQSLPITKELCQEDLKIFRLVIHQQENEVAIAKVWVPPESIIKNMWAVISYEDNQKQTHTLFQGRPVGFPRVLSQEHVEIELSAEPNNAQQQLTQYAEELKVPVLYDSLFIERNDDNPVNGLEARNDLFYWDRCTGKLSLSNLFEGKRHLDLSAFILDGTLKLRLGETPLSSIHVEVQAEWTQRVEGEFNLFPKIAEKFSQGKMNTLTPQQLLKNWPKIGEKIGPEKTRKQSGYQVVRSVLEEVPALRTGILNLYPSVTPEIRVQEDAQPQRLKRSWFEGELWLDWHYRQKRREVACFTLQQQTQLDGRIRPYHKCLKIQLQKIDSLLDASCASFFHTPRGQQAIDHALERAKAYLAGRSRCVDVQFQVPFEKGFDISLDDTVILQGNFIPYKKLQGKVVEYHIKVTETEKTVWIRLGVAVGQQQQNFKVASHHQTPSGISYQPFKSQYPVQGVIDPEKITLDRLVESVVVHGDGKEQTDFLLGCPPTLTSIHELLAEKPTVIEINLMDLRTCETLEHSIHLTIDQPWTAPCQIDLKEGNSDDF